MTETLELLWSALWADNPPVGKVVIVVIGVLLVRAVYVARNHLARYRRERRSLDRVAATLEDWRLDSRTDEEEPPGEEDDESTVRASEQDAADEENGERENAEGDDGDDDGTASEEAPSVGGWRQPDLVSPDTLLEGIDPRSLIGDRIRAIAKMRSYRVRVDLDTLQQLSARRDDAVPGHGFPAFAAGLAMMLGILGTFIGLAAMVQQIHLGLPRDVQAVDLETWVSSIGNLRSVLGGMKTAFSTSLVGMATAVVASSLDHRIRGARRAVFERLERLTAEELLPATIPAVEDELLLESVSLRLEESFERLDEISRENRQTLQDLDAIEGAFVEIVDEVRDITRAQAARNLDSLIEQIGRANEGVVRVAEQVPRIARSMEQMGQRITRAVEESTWHARVPATDSGGDRILGLRPIGWVMVLTALVVGLVLIEISGGG